MSILTANEVFVHDSIVIMTLRNYFQSQIFCTLVLFCITVGHQNGQINGRTLIKKMIQKEKRKIYFYQYLNFKPFSCELYLLDFSLLEFEFEDSCYSPDTIQRPYLC